MAAVPSREFPTLIDDAWFALRAFGLRALRHVKETLPGRAVSKFARGDAFAAAPVVAEIGSPLWTQTGGERDFLLTAGKVHNLRLAARAIDGIELPAGAVFSFWKQCGPPWRLRGFVRGREIREGCLIPTPGGGLCQLSNALYDAALASGCEIVERHAHTRAVAGSRAALGRDATVFWNYVDFRFRAPRPLRIEAELTADRLFVRFRSPAAPTSSLDAATERAPRLANDCLTCGRTDCRHELADPRPAPSASTVWALDARSPELETYFRAAATGADALILPTRRFAPARYGWPAGLCGREASADLATLRRALTLRGAGQGGALQARALAADAKLAAAYARRLAPVDRRLVVAQNLLPHLWRLGALGGRRFSVAMTRLPMRELQAVLDAAAARYPGSPTLADFRAPEAIVAAEEAALAAADEVLTPHAGVAAGFPDRAVLLPWGEVAPLRARRGGRRIWLPASALARKGAYALREALQGLDGAELLISGRAIEHEGFWDHARARLLAGGEQPSELAAVVLPAIVEHQPQRLLAAIAAGVPVIATPACGLSPRPGLTLVPAMDAQALREALAGVLEGAL